jgi:SM-20-related protein
VTVSPHARSNHAEAELGDLEGVVDGSMLETMSNALRHRGFVVVPDALPRPVTLGLRAELDRLQSGGFTRAGVGRDGDWQRLDRVRRDHIHWLDSDSTTTAWYFAWIESLRLGLNRSLFLGLFDYECHFAWYPLGGYYRTHLDAFRGEDNRKVSTVLYLNDGWKPSDGGELVIHEPVDDQRLDDTTIYTVARIVTPRFGTMVLFLSEEFPHEVLTAARARYSLAGWFRVNASGSGTVDPPVFALSS